MSTSPTRSCEPMLEPPLAAGDEDLTPQTRTAPDSEEAAVTNAAHTPQAASRDGPEQSAHHQPTEGSRHSPAESHDPLEIFASPAALSFPTSDGPFHSAPMQHQDDMSSSYQETAPEGLLPPPDFKPFFTLIEDAETGETHHPTVHYVFSDDDPELMTSAALDAIERDPTESSEKPEERMLILDIAPDGKHVVAVTSLSPNWQMVKTATRLAPSWGGEENEGDAGLMLTISGQEAKNPSSGGHARDKKRSSDLDNLVKAFGERLQGLDEVLGREDDENDDVDDNDRHEETTDKEGEAVI